MRAFPRRNIQVCAFIGLFFVAIAPTLSWPEFSGDSEDLLVQTTLEMRSGGPWWVPTLGGMPRMRKPPLPAWISAAAVSDATVRRLSDPDLVARDAAYRQLAFQVRWPALMAGCLLLLALAWMADLIGGPAHVLPALLIGATTLLLIRFVRSATTDIYLALWVTLANACLAAALLRGRRWLGLAGAGAAIGLATMCKGPVALIQTILPFVVFAWAQQATAGRAVRKGDQGWAGPIFAGLFLMLAIATPWFIITAIREPNSVGVWLAELKRKDTATLSHDPWYGYVALIPNLLPWLPLYLGGIAIAIPSMVRGRRIGLALLLLFVPIVALSFFHDRKDRYLLPLIGPAAILAAHAAVRLKRAYPLRKIDAKIGWWAHWGIFGAFAVALPLLGMLQLRREDGRHWYPPLLGGGAIGVGLLVIAAGWVLQKRHRSSFIVTGAALMLGLTALMLYGWSASNEGRSEMKPVADLIRAKGAADRVAYYDAPPAGGEPVTMDLNIYLDQQIDVLQADPTTRDYRDASAVVMLWENGKAQPVFAGWHLLFDLTRRKHHWLVLSPDAK